MKIKKINLKSILENEGKEKKRIKLRKKDLLFIAIPVIAAIVAVIVVLSLVGKEDSYVPASSAKQYYAGNAYSFSNGTVFERDSEKGTVVDAGDGLKVQVGGLPVYMPDSGRIMLPDSAIYYNPRTGAFGCLPYFTELSMSNGGNVSAVRDGKSISLDAGFIYDGGNVYLFLEPVTVSFNNYSIELPALSYIEADYRGEVMLFNYSDKSFFSEASAGPVTAVAGNGDYTVSLYGDSYTGSDGSTYLLFTEAEVLDSLFAD